MALASAVSEAPNMSLGREGSPGMGVPCAVVTGASCGRVRARSGGPLGRRSATPESALEGMVGGSELSRATGFRGDTLGESEIEGTTLERSIRAAARAVRPHVLTERALRAAPA